MRFCALFLICLTIPSAASQFTPTIANPGFEEIAPGNDAPGWAWYNRATASFHSETQNPHSGNRCLVFANQSGLAPEVYGRLAQGVPVEPDVEYELAVWVQGEDVAPGIHFTDWKSYTLNLPEGTFAWRKVSVVFKTGHDQHDLSIGINVVNRCKALAIDDISLRAKGIPITGRGVTGSFVAPGQIQGDNGKAYLAITLDSRVAGVVKAEVKGGGTVIFNKQARIEPGESTFEWEWNSGTVPVRDLRMTVIVEDENGRRIATADRNIEKLSSTVISSDLDHAEGRLKEFDALYAKCRAKGIPLDYPTVTRTMLTQFIPLERLDILRGEERRADYAVKDFTRSLDSAIAEMRAFLADPRRAPDAVRYKTSKMDINGVSFVADRQDARGAKSRGPVFFCGMGHFSQVRKDMFRWPGYGVNIIQIEVGPGVTLPSEDEIDLKPAQDIVRVLDEAAAKNVKVNILLSPHYFPAWAMQKWPKLGQGGGGFLGFCVDAPEAKQVIEKFLRAVIPLFKDKPALHSFCLSNEPFFDRTAGCDDTRAMWSDYLARTHGSLQTMNARYGTNYADFADVPIPGNNDFDAPQFYDYCVFNDERFAGWHKWMADVIHEMAPDVPVHAKVMAWTFLGRGNVAWGTSAEMFGQFGQINGNDCAMWPGPEGAWAISWGTQNMAYDLQRSLNPKPIFNSENHLTPDGSTFYVPPEHFRTALWQGAIHGQGATTIWVWERTVDRSMPWYASTTPFYGNVMDRPGCAEAVGRTCLDLNRFAAEVTALETKPAPVAILYSIASVARNERHFGAMGRAYTALNFLGVKVDFISEKQLAQGKGAKYRLIVLPEATHIPMPTFQALFNLPASTKLAIIGGGPEKDPYGKSLAHAMNESLPNAVTYPSDADARKVLWPGFGALLDKLGARPDVRVVDPKTGEAVWGVEWLSAAADGARTVMNIVNLTTKPVDVAIVGRGGGTAYTDPKSMPQEVPLKRTLAARDLLSLGGTEKVGRLLPITPVLAEISAK